jgi:hypothetical protein
MKNSPLTTVLLGVLGISALLSLVFCWSYMTNAREFRQLQTQATFINGRQAAMNALLNDALEYSKKNPQIDPILEAAGLKPRAGAAATNKPASK